MTMTYRKSLAVVLVASTMLGGAAYAAEQAAQPPVAQMSPAQKAVDTDVGKLSKDGAQAFRDMHLARVAIYEADPAQAKDLIGKAQAALAKARSDETVFRKAESDLRTPAEMSAGKTAAKTAAKTATDTAPTAAATAPAAASDAKPGANEQVAWLPIDAQLTLDEDFVATPEKAAAVSDANTSLQKGDKTGALEKLKLAHVDVNFTMAVLPLDKTTADVDQAATLIGQGKYYEANALLKTAEDRMRFDVIDALAVPKVTAQAQGAKAAPLSTGTTQAAKPAK